MNKIVFIHLYNDRSGSPRVLAQIIFAVQQHGLLTKLLTSSHQNGFLSGVGDEQDTLFYRRSENKLLTLFYYIVSQILLFLQCLRYWNQDVVFYINTMMPFGAALAGKLMGKEVYYHIHETSIRPKLLKQFLRFIISLTSKKIIFVSKYLREVENFKNKKQIIIYNAINSEFLLNIKEKNQNNIFEVLMVCSLKKYKGIFEFIKIADKLLEYDYIKFTLVLNAEQSEIDDYFKSEELPSNLNLYSRQMDVSSFYSKADLLMNLSRPNEVIESFGLTILEGMAYGLPVIVPPVGGPAEIVHEGVEGFLISCYEIEKIADKIIFLASNQSEYNKFSANALKRINDFSEKEFKKNIYKLFEDKQ